MRKVHVKVTLDVFVHADDDADVVQRINDSRFILDPENNACDENVNVLDITTEEVSVTDSR